jgi:hypothetical protein
MPTRFSTFLRASAFLGQAALAGTLLVGGTSALSGCTSSTGSTDPGSSGSSGTSGQTSTACDKDTRKDIYSAGLAKQSSALSVKIVESTPSPPKKGTNTMMLEISDPAGKPIDGATVSVTPWMPDHAHGSAVTPLVTPMSGGKYNVEKIYYPMPGLWRVTVTVQIPGAAPQEVAFNFCFDG